jgi:hypothetical protein
MTTGMQALLDSFRKLATDTQEQNAGKRHVVFSVESPPNEYFMPSFQICDARVTPPGHSGFEKRFLPLYHFLYHEFTLIQGGFGFGPEPYHMPIRNAYNLVLGEIPGGVLKGDGGLLNKDTINWAPWEPPVGNNEDSLEILRRTAALRRGKGKDFLVYGRMQRPAEVTGIKTVQWDWERVHNEIPAVFHSAWQSPEGRFGIVLANWTKEPQTIAIAERRLGEQVDMWISAEELKSHRAGLTNHRMDASLPPLSCALIQAT